MKKFKMLFALIFVLTIFTLAGCDNTSIEVLAKQESVRIKDSEIPNYNFKELFTITKDGENLVVLDSYIDYSDVKAEAGTYSVTCTYEGKSASVNVEVVKSVYLVDLAKDEIIIRLSESLKYDYKALFTASMDGEKIEITEEMITTDVVNAIGTYTYKVSLGSSSKTLTINIIADYIYEVRANYNQVTIKENDLKNYDYSSLFTITRDGETLEVLDAYLNYSRVKPEAGTYLVTCSYEGKNAAIEIVVVDSIYILELSQTEITLEKDKAVDFDFNSLFTGSIDGEDIEINSALVTTDLELEVGTYTYLVKVGPLEQELTINIIENRNIEVSSRVAEVTIKRDQVTTYDYTQLFQIIEDGEEQEVLLSYIDYSAVEAEIGTYLVICDFEGRTASVNVHVEEVDDEIILTTEEISVKLRDALSFDYNELFIVKVAGARIEITEEMIETNLKEELGTYNYKVSLGSISKTLLVHIINNHEIEIIPTYPNLEIELADLNTFDFTSLFALYVDGAPVQVTLEMLDTSELDSAEPNNTYEVSLSYDLDGSKNTMTTKILVIPNSEYIINSKNIVTYPNGEYIDFTSLFTITKGENEIPVTPEMVSGTIDYSKPGLNTITLDFAGQTKTATVEVKLGVIIDYAKTDTVIIIQGTRQNTYLFTNDFLVLINGIKFNNISDSYILPHEVDFETVGTYEVTIEIPYNDQRFGLGGVNFTYFEKTITYVVVENEGNILVQQDLVTLPKNTESYNVYSNLSVTINGRSQTLIEIKEYVDVITCYVETLSEPLDFTKLSRQEVVIAVYVNGVNAEPEIVSYFVIMASDIVITKNIPALFKGDTFYTKDLFTIKDGDQEVEVTYEMLTGKVDTLNPGVYLVTLNYLDFQEEARVVVLNSEMKGTYQTNIPLITIPEVDDDLSDYGDDDEHYYYGGMGLLNYLPSYEKPNLVIGVDGNVYYGDKKLEISYGIDEFSLAVMSGMNEFILSYENGIIFMNPINSIKSRFYEERRPLLYFNTSQWELLDYFEINSGGQHVLEGNSLSYTLDAFQVRSKIDGSKLWYAMKTHLISRSSSDTIYDVTWGRIEFDSNFNFEPGLEFSAEYLGETYRFSMQEPKVGKLLAAIEDRKYASKIYTGVIDGKPAELRANQYQAFTLLIDSDVVFSVTQLETERMKNGGVDYETDTVFLYDYDKNIFSYKFVLDVETLTFELIERDLYFGKYESDNVYIYLDGYGTGIINFNTSSYQTTLFDYRVNHGIVELQYKDIIDDRFAYGEYSTLYLDPFLNVLTFKYCEDKALEGLKLENSFVTDGAIINIGSYKVGKDTDSAARARLYSNIEIITKDGVLSDTEKASRIDTTRVRFNTPGFYQLAITVEVAGNAIVSYYAVQVLDDTYAGHPLVATYGPGVILSNNSLAIDKYGQATIVSNETIYRGVVKITSDNSFVINALSATNASIVLVGNEVAPGIVLVICSGAVNFTDYFTTGITRASGFSNYVLREITVAGDSTYLLSGLSSSIGEIVSVKSINDIPPSLAGSMVEITTSTGILYVKIMDWNNLNNGLVLADSYRGVYTTTDGENLELDGFGTAKLGSEQGLYVLNSNVVTVEFFNSVKLYRLNLSDYTYEIVNIVLDESLVSGFTFSAEHRFSCNSWSYTANTSFSFAANGVVVIKSTSEEHDSGEYRCEEDLYEPSYASKDGVTGQYSVNGNKITINVNGEVFVFVINDVLRAHTITCLSTTLVRDNHGYFAIDTIFRK